MNENMNNGEPLNQNTNPNVEEVLNAFGPNKPETNTQNMNNSNTEDMIIIPKEKIEQITSRDWQIGDVIVVKQKEYVITDVFFASEKEKKLKRVIGLYDVEDQIVIEAAVAYNPTQFLLKLDLDWKLKK